MSKYNKVWKALKRLFQYIVCLNYFLIILGFFLLNTSYLTKLRILDANAKLRHELIAMIFISWFVEHNTLYNVTIWLSGLMLMFSVSQQLVLDPQVCPLVSN